MPAPKLQLTAEGRCRVLTNDRRWRDVGRALRVQSPAAYEAVLVGAEVTIVAPRQPG